MFGKLNRFNFAHPSITTEVMLFGCVIWVAVWGCAMWSIVSKYDRLPARLFWMAVVTFLPLVGLMIYLPFSLRQEFFLPYLFRYGRKSDGSS